MVVIYFAPLTLFLTAVVYLIGEVMYLYDDYERAAQKVFVAGAVLWAVGQLMAVSSLPSYNAAFE